MEAFFDRFFMLLLYMWLLYMWLFYYLRLRGVVGGVLVAIIMGVVLNSQRGIDFVVLLFLRNDRFNLYFYR